MKYLNRYRNPWHKTLNVPRPEFYENNAPVVLEHRGVTVYKLCEKSYDFVLAGTCITQRAGITRAKEVIDGILDGDGENLVNEDVRRHIAAQGFTPMSYEDATELGR